MTGAETRTTGATAVGRALTDALAAVGLRPEPAVDGSTVAEVTGPFLTADLVDGRDTVVVCLAVLDDPAGQPDEVLQAAVDAVVADFGPVETLSARPGEPVADGAGLLARFAMPTEVAGFGDGDGVKLIQVRAADRRGGGEAATGGPRSTATSSESGAATGGVPMVTGLDKLINVSLAVSVELGRTKVTLADVLDYDVGSVIELDRAAGAPVDIRVNDTLLAQGEVVLIDDEYAVRITAIFDPNQGRS